MEKEQFLFAAIDSGIRKTTNAPLPSSLLQRLEARLAHEIPSQRTSANWIYAAVAVAALLLLTLPILRWRGSAGGSLSQGKDQVSVAQTAIAEQKLAEASPRLFSAVTRGVRGKLRATRHFANEGPQVLVPSEEREAFARFVSSMAERKEFAAALVTPAPERNSEFLRLEPLQIAWLEIEPLGDANVAVVSER